MNVWGQMQSSLAAGTGCPLESLTWPCQGTRAGRPRQKQERLQRSQCSAQEQKVTERFCQNRNQDWSQQYRLGLELQLEVSYGDTESVAAAGICIVTGTMKELATETGAGTAAEAGIETGSVAEAAAVHGTVAAAVSGPGAAGRQEWLQWEQHPVGRADIDANGIFDNDLCPLSRQVLIELWM